MYGVSFFYGALGVLAVVVVELSEEVMELVLGVVSYSVVLESVEVIHFFDIFSVSRTFSARISVTAEEVVRQEVRLPLLPLNEMNLPHYVLQMLGDLSCARLAFLQVEKRLPAFLVEKPVLVAYKCIYNLKCAGRYIFSNCWRQFALFRRHSYGRI